MIHIATVHWRTDKWIGIQRSYLRKHISSPYRVYAWLNDVPPPPADAFYHTCSEPLLSHPTKLNILADTIYSSSNRTDDILMFLDGDAFPIGDIESLIHLKLRDYRLLAVQRLENNGDIQPHPCFSATTVSFWHSIKGDWKSGYSWRNTHGKRVTDVGGNLLRQLTEHRAAWYPLLRSNTRNLHPVFFGTYDRVIYHHGSGFRAPLTRFDRSNVIAQRIYKLVATHLPRYGLLSQRLLFRTAIAQNTALSDRVYGQIQQDPGFSAEFL